MAPHMRESEWFAEYYIGSKSGGGVDAMLGVRKDAHNSVKKPAAGAATAVPTIRVIHIFAPKVIKTDVANFRSTVQRLTGRSKRSAAAAGRRTLRKTVTAAISTVVDPSGDVDARFASSAVWDQQAQERSQKEVIQRLVGDACGGADHLARCSSMESTYSMDSGNFSGDSNDSDLQSPTGSCGFSFYPHRQSPGYSLNEIPAPFFAGDAIHPFVDPMAAAQASSCGREAAALGTSFLPAVMEHPNMHNMLGFSDMDIVSGLGSALPLPDFPTIPPLGSAAAAAASSGSLYEMFMSPPPLCRLSVPSQFYGANIFEF